MLKTAEYIKKMKQFTLIKKLIHNRLPLGLLNKYMDYRSQDTEDFVVAKLRGFGAAENFLHKFRIKPSACLLRNIHYRCSNYTAKMHQDKIAMHQLTNSEMTKNGIFVPGCFHGSNRSCWL